MCVCVCVYVCVCVCVCCAGEKGSKATVQTSGGSESRYFHVEIHGTILYVYTTHTYSTT